jgi:hypothetical protein
MLKLHTHVPTIQKGECESSREEFDPCMERGQIVDSEWSESWVEGNLTCAWRGNGQCNKN